jgi:hypothetical protein
LVSETASGNAILYINPHTTFYLDLRYSDEGLNVQCRTWDSFFYQGLTTIVDGCTPRQTVAICMPKISAKDQLFYEYDGIKTCYRKISTIT